MRFTLWMSQAVLAEFSLSKMEQANKQIENEITHLGSEKSRKWEKLAFVWIQVECSSKYRFFFTWKPSRACGTTQN